MKSILLLLIFVCTCAAGPIPKMDRDSAAKIHEDFLKRHVQLLPYNGPNQKLITGILSECFEDIRLTEPAAMRENMPFRQDVYEDIVFKEGFTNLKGTFWYLTFSSNVLGSDYQITYVYSPKEKKVTGKF